MENIAKVREFLGGAKVIGRLRSELDFVDIIRQGFPLQAFAALRDKAKLTDEAICGSLRIARRTAQRRKQQAERLKPVESELLLRLARVLAAASETLGSVEHAREWLLHENRSLGGSLPIELLDTGPGFQEVMDVLKRIDHGVYS